MVGVESRVVMGSGEAFWVWWVKIGSGSACSETCLLGERTGRLA